VKKDFFVISFESTHYAMMMEKRLKEKFKVDMIPTPRCITASCGLSLKMDTGLIEEVILTLKSFDVDKTMFQIYRICKTGQEDQVTPIDWEDNP